MRVLKLFLTLLGSTAIIFSSAYFGPKVFGSESKPVSNSPTTKVKVRAENVQPPAASTAEKEGVISQASINTAYLPTDLEIFTENYAKIEIPADSTFSLLDFLKKASLDKAISTESVSAIGTLIYQLILPTNFSIEERNIGSQLPRYANLGFESKVSGQQNLDLIFYNPNQTKYTISFQADQGKMNAVLTGVAFAEQYKIRTSDEQTYKPKTIIQYSPLLSTGQKKVVTAGENGKLIRVYKDSYQNDQLTKSQLVTEDYYPPVHQVEIHAMSTPSSQQTTTSTVSSDNQPATAVASEQQTGAQTQTPATESSQSIGTDQAGTATGTESDLWGKPNEQPK